jgi:hypothetical protein
MLNNLEIPRPIMSMIPKSMTMTIKTKNLPMDTTPTGLSPEHRNTTRRMDMATNFSMDDKAKSIIPMGVQILKVMRMTTRRCGDRLYLGSSATSSCFMHIRWS